MTPYQLGYLFGGVAGAVLGAVLVYKAFQSKTRASRWWGVFGAVLALLYLATTAAKFSSQNMQADFTAGFTRGCADKCAVEHGEPALCQIYCDCQAKRILALPQSARVIERLRKVRSQADIPADVRAPLADIATECTPPKLYDVRFMANCTAACAGSTCPASCQCYLDKLREGMEPQAGTVWLIHHVDAEPATPEGEVRAAAATQACAHLMGGG